MKASWRVALLAGALLALGATAASAEKGKSEEFHWSGTLAAGKSIEVGGVNGPIEIVAGTGDRVEVHAIKTARRDDPSEVRIQVQPDGEGLVVCAVYPGSGNACGRGHSQHVSRNDVQVDFRVTVPAGAIVDAHTVNGAVRVSGMTGHVKAATVNGECQLETRGSAEASTVNGEVHARLGRVAPTDRLEFSTVNGGVLLVLPDEISADVHASTVNGSIRTSFPLTVQGNWGPKRLSGRLGSGGAKLRLSTVNGAIRMERPGTRTL